MFAHITEDHTASCVRKSDLTLMTLCPDMSKKSVSSQSTPLSSISWDDTTEEL